MIDSFFYTLSFRLIVVSLCAATIGACADRQVSLDEKLTGTWQNDCYKYLQHGVYARNRITFSSDGIYKNEMLHYADSNCVTFTGINTQYSVTGIYYVGKSLTTSEGLAAREIDIYMHIDNHDPNSGYNDVLLTIYSIATDGRTMYLGGSDINTGTRPISVNTTISWQKFS